MLKKSLTCTFFAALLCISCAAADAFTIKNISFSLRTTPIPRYENDTSRVRSGSKNRWLRLYVDFIPAEKRSGDGEVEWV